MDKDVDKLKSFPCELDKSHFPKLSMHKECKSPSFVHTGSFGRVSKKPCV
jgi:hypothetical protein